jgi:hypothetical protein
MTDEYEIGEVDIDGSRIEIDKKWHTTDELKTTIKSKIETGDYDVTLYANALKKLEITLNAIEEVQVRVPVSVLSAYQDLAKGSSTTVESCMRAGITEYLKHHDKLKPLDENAVPSSKNEKKKSRGKKKSR